MHKGIRALGDGIHTYMGNKRNKRKQIMSINSKRLNQGTEAHTVTHTHLCT